MASYIRDVKPRLDDPFWNFYENITRPGHIAPITIPIAFTFEGVEVAAADFRCLGSPRNLAWLALHKTLAAHPGLRWDGVYINCTPHSRADAEARMNADPHIRYGDYKLTTPMELLREFNLNLTGIDIGTAGPERLREALDDNRARIAARICAGAYDIEWRKGGPGLLSSLCRAVGME